MAYYFFMKKVLILANDFPPYVSVGGLRQYSWYDYFHKFGIYPIVVNRQCSHKHKKHLDCLEAGLYYGAKINDSLV